MSVKTEQGRKLPAVPIVSAFSSVITFLLVPHDCVNVNQMGSVRVLRDGGVCSQRGLRGWLGVVDCRQRWCFFRAKHQRATSWLRRGRCRTGTTRTDTPPETRWRLTGGKRRAAGRTRRTRRKRTRRPSDSVCQLRRAGEAGEAATLLQLHLLSSEFTLKQQFWSLEFINMWKC